MKVEREVKKVRHQQLYVMVMESSIGLMAHIMRVSGPITKLKVKVHSGMLKVTCIEVSSKTTWLMVMEITHTSMDLSTKENLEMMSKRVTVKRNGLMVPNILAATKMV